MTNNVKMKPVQTGMMVFTLLLIGSVIIGRIFFGEPGFHWTLSSIQIPLALIHFIVFLRTRFWIYLIPAGMYTLWWLTFFPPLADHPLHLVFAVSSAVFLAAFIAVLVSRRIDWRYKDILLLSARHVSETADGFTPRPYPTGKTEFSREDALGLSRYLKKYMIAYPFIEPDRAVLVIPEYMWLYMLFLKRDYKNSTYVVFSRSGQVIVRIAERDYTKYKEEFTFDQLCASLGDLFKQFMSWYRENHPEKIFHLLVSGQQGRHDGKK